VLHNGTWAFAHAKNNARPLSNAAPRDAPETGGRGKKPLKIQVGISDI